jgi:hypothetical protein
VFDPSGRETKVGHIRSATDGDERVRAVEATAVLQCHPHALVVGMNGGNRGRLEDGDSSRNQRLLQARGQVSVDPGQDRRLIGD